MRRFNFGADRRGKTVLRKRLKREELVLFMKELKLQGQGYGSRMVQWCATLVRRMIMPYIGCRFLAVDAKRNSVTFYERLGFELLNTESNIADKNPLIFIDIYKNKPVKLNRSSIQEKSAIAILDIS